MDFEWQLKKDADLTFDDKVQNLACFEIVLNILRMKSSAKDMDVAEEVQALCSFALDCMFDTEELKDDVLFEAIMKLKNNKVSKFRAKMLKDLGMPSDTINANEIGEA